MVLDAFILLHLSLTFNETILPSSKADIPVYLPAHTGENQGLHLLANTQEGWRPVSYVCVLGSLSLKDFIF